MLKYENVILETSCPYVNLHAFSKQNRYNLVLPDEMGLMGQVMMFSQR